MRLALLVALVVASACAPQVGPPGPAGPQGEQGPAGPPGAKGDPGAATATFHLIDTLNGEDLGVFVPIADHNIKYATAWHPTLNGHLYYGVAALVAYDAPNCVGNAVGAYYLNPDGPLHAGTLVILSTSHEIARLAPSISVFVASTFSDGGACLAGPGRNITVFPFTSTGLTTTVRPPDRLDVVLQ